MRKYLDIVVSILMLVTITLHKLTIIPIIPPLALSVLRLGLWFQIIGVSFVIMYIWAKFRFNSQKDWERMVILQMKKDSTVFKKGSSYVDQLKEKITKDSYKLFVIIILNTISLLLTS